MTHRWELDSSVPGVGFLVKTLAPSDTYTVYKQVGEGVHQGPYYTPTNMWEYLHAGCCLLGQVWDDAETCS